MPNKKKAFIVRDFTDAGLEQNFTASVAGEPDTMPEIDAGVFANYAAAGLVRLATEADQSPPQPEAADAA